MIDSGASETVALIQNFPHYKVFETTAIGDTYSSDAGRQMMDIVNVGGNAVETIDEHGVSNWVQCQMCKRVGADKMLGNESRLVQANHTVVF